MVSATRGRARRAANVGAVGWVATTTTSPVQGKAIGVTRGDFQRSRSRPGDRDIDPTLLDRHPVHGRARRGDRMRVVFVHGACVKDGAWWWHPTAELAGGERRNQRRPGPAELRRDRRGARRRGAGAGRGRRRGPRGADRRGDEPTVVVAHSYGGIVTAEAAAGLDSVRHLLLISSYLPEVGQSLSSFGGEEPAPFLEIDPEGGTFTVRPDALAETFLQDCDPEIQRAPSTGPPARASPSSARRWVRRPGSGSPRPTSSAPRTAARPPTASASSPPAPARRRARLRPPPVPVAPAAVRDLVLSL